AEAAIGAADRDRGITFLHAALELVATGPTRVSALLALGDTVYVERPLEALPLLVSALDHTGGDPLLSAMVHSHIGAVGDMDPAQAHRSAEIAARILSRADLTPDPEHLACALLDRAFHCLLRGEPAAPDDIERGLRLRSGTGETFVVRRAQEVAERCLFHL